MLALGILSRQGWLLVLERLGPAALQQQQQRQRRQLLHSSCASFRAAGPLSAVKETSTPDVAHMDSATLQSLAGLIYLRAETFESYLSRKEEEVAQQLQVLISKLDPARQALLMHKLTAVSDKRATPVIMGWVLSCIRQEASKLLQGGQQHAAALQLTLAAAAREAATEAGRDLQAMPSAEGLVKWLLDAKTPWSWEQILQMPGLEQLLDAASRSDPKLDLACRVLGLDGFQHGPLHASLLEALGALSADSMRLLKAAVELEPDAPTPLDLLSKAAAAAAAAAGDEALPDLTKAAVGLALAQLVSCQLGLLLAPDTQLVTRLLHVSPFHVLAPAEQEAGAPADPHAQAQRPSAAAAAAAAAAAGISGPLLQSVVKQLAQQAGVNAAEMLKAAAAPGWPQGQADPRLLAMLVTAAASQPDSPAALLLSHLRAWRKAALLAGVPCIMAAATPADLAALSPEEAQAVQGAARRLDAMGGALEHLVLPAAAASSSGSLSLELDTVQALSLELRLGLAWRLRGPAAARRAAPALTRALHRTSSRRHHQHSREGASFDNLITAFALEQRAAELELVSDRSLPSGLGAEALLAAEEEHFAARLPSESQLKGLAKKAGGQQQQQQQQDWDVELFDALLAGEASETQVLAAFEVLIQSMDGQEDPGTKLEVPAAYKDWFYDAKLAVNKLSPAMLALLRRFLSLKIQASKADAFDAQQCTRLLLQAVQAEIRRADRSCAGPSLPAPYPSTTAPAPSTTISPYWMSLDVAQQEKVEQPPALPTEQGTISKLDPAIVKSLLRDPEAKEFAQWLRSVALQRSSGPYDLLAEQHLEMDMQRYVMMRHHPDLGLSFEQPPRPWKEAGSKGIGSEEEFLEGMKAGLTSYLTARGMEAPSSIEWEAYKQHALAEFSVFRQANEEALREAGHSTFFNSRAEEEYLGSVLQAGVPSSSPLHTQARRYLEVLGSNSSWSFAQKKQVVKRLVELSTYFSQQGAGSERGSPFAPLFSDSDKALVPTLPKTKPEPSQPTALPPGY